MKSEKRTLSREIANYLLGLIKQNGEIPNFKLPSESELRLKFNVSHIPVRSAYASLIERGLVISWHGKGYFIKNSLYANSMPSLKNIAFVAPAVKTMSLIFDGIRNYCEKNMLNPLFMVSDQDVKKEKLILQSLIPSGCKGLIIFPIDNNFYNEELLRLSLQQFPIVLVDRYLQKVNLSYIATDSQTALTDAVKFLYEKNYKHIVYATTPVTATIIEERLNGYRYGMRKYYKTTATEKDILLQIKPDDYPAIQHAITEYLRTHPETEVLIVTGMQAISAIKAAAELNIAIPEKLRLMIIDSELSDTERNAVRPYLIQGNGYEMGRRACEVLYGHIYGDRRVVTEKIPSKIL